MKIRKIFAVLTVIFIISCDKNYEIIGDHFKEEKLKFCIEKKIDPEHYIFSNKPKRKHWKWRFVY